MFGLPQRFEVQDVTNLRSDHPRKKVVQSSDRKLSEVFISAIVFMIGDTPGP